MNPSISIIVPVYNTEPFVNKCLDSIISQSFKNIEIIVVNDGSTDNSGKICDEFALKDPRIKVVHKENGGLSSARNTGIKIAKGEYLGFVDSDDHLEKDMYKVLYGLCKETNSDISICKFKREINGITKSESNEEIILEMNHEEAMKHLFRGEYFRFSVCNKLFKRNCFDHILFPIGRVHEDLATTYKVFSNARKSVYTSYPGYVYVRREESILTTNFNESRLDAFIGWKEILSFMSANYPQLGNVFFSCFVYSCIDNIHNILSQVGRMGLREKYLNVIRQVVREYYLKLILNHTLSIKNMLTITMLLISPNILSFLIKSKRLLGLGIK